MCLQQASSQRDYTSGTMCVTAFTFVLATQIVGQFECNGIIGLAPTGGANNFITQLKKHGQIAEDKALVSLNFENPIDTD